MARTHLSFPALVLAILCLVAAALRVYRLDDAVLSRDEGSSWRVSRYEPLELVRHCAANVHAPLSFFLLKAWTAAFGDSVFAMRSLSVLYGVLCVPLIYFTVLESARLRLRKLDVPAPHNEIERNVVVIAPRDEIRVDPRQITSLHYGAFLAAALIAFHPLQIEVSRAARMYSLGALLTLASTWLLLRALQSGPRAAFAWFTYSLTAAALAYTHIYGLFTVAAQLAFAAGYVLPRSRAEGKLPASLDKESPPSSAAPASSTRFQKLDAHAAVLLPICCSAGLILVLYSPWLPVLQSQTHEVSVKYWIPPLTLHELGFAFDEWTFGDGHLLPWPGVAGLGLALLLLVLAIARRTPCAALFFGVAALPWLALCVFYLATGNSVLQLRYLAVAQAGLFLLIGAVMTARVNAMVCASIAVYLAIVASNGAVTPATPIEPSALPELATWLAPQHRQSDLVLVDDFRELTRLEYYLVHAGIAPLDIRTRISPFRPTGHTVHLGSLSGANIIYDQQLRSLDAARIWHVGREPPVLGGWQQFKSWQINPTSHYVVRGLMRS